jgi:hypothetical protein
MKGHKNRINRKKASKKTKMIKNLEELNRKILGFNFMVLQESGIN